MANNRMFLLHKPSGLAVFLGKRMGWGWYGTPADVAERITRLFELVETQEAEGSQDDFCVALEDCSQATSAFGKWRYSGDPGRTDSLFVLRVREALGDSS